MESLNDQIIIIPYDPKWKAMAIDEINLIKTQAASLQYDRIEHIGSTAVPDLDSKPIIDIMIVIDDIDQGYSWVEVLEKIDYVFWSDNPDKNHLRLFKGMPPFGNGRTHHIHIVSKNNPIWVHRVLFKDILTSNQQIRKEYEALKKALAIKYKNDREAYTENKGEFIKMVLSEAGFNV